MTRLSLITAAALAVLVSGCTVQETPAPPLTGPSEFALRIALRAIPDSILQDGASQAVIEIEAGGPDGRPIRGLPLRIEMQVNGQPFDFGTLSSKTVVTDNDGRARVTYTAPPRTGTTDDVFDPTVVTFFVTPIGNDYQGQQPRTVDLRLVTPGVIQPPNAAPQADFTFQPSAPQILTDVVFDASGTTDPDLGVDATGGVAPCGTRCTYRWDFGDGGTGTGIFATHQFRNIGSYLVTLTATDERGASSTRTRSVTVGGGTPPTASFTFSPTSPAINQAVFFNAEASRAASGRRIVSYDWNFGNGRTDHGVTVSRAFSAAGTYTVTLTVTDDAGSQATATQTVQIGAPGSGPTARMTVSPGQGLPQTNFFFDASASTPGPNPIIEYRFTFGDATPDVVGTSPTTTHRYTTPGNYTARVTVRDSAGRTATADVQVTVQ
jgi:PKD repeat protein